MLIDQKLIKLAEIGKGKLIGEDSSFYKISTDTRSINEGDVFLALKGDIYDGHDYLDEAIKKVAKCLISENEFKGSIPYIKTTSTNLFLENIAKAQRELFTGSVIAITGSNGKTSTKQILFDLLESLDQATKYDGVVGVVPHTSYLAIDAAEIARILKVGGVLADLKGMWRGLELPDEFARWEL